MTIQQQYQQTKVIGRAADCAPLIPIGETMIGGDLEQTINARDLHAFLEVGKDFTTWVKDRINQYDFVDGVDFTIVETLSSPISGSTKARPQRVKEYHLALNMAKELAMVERNDKGKQARQYFIECERRAKANVIGAGWAAIPQTLPEALRLAADLAEQKALAEIGRAHV